MPDDLALSRTVEERQGIDGVRALPALWWRCTFHQVLVKIGNPCSACLTSGPGGMSLRGEHFDIAEAREGWSPDAPRLQGGAKTTPLKEKQHV